MTYMFSFHHAMVGFLLVLAFFTGAVNEGRKAVIDKLTAHDLMQLSIYELSRVDIDRIKL